jgi:hypothetical protein
MWSRDTRLQGEVMAARLHELSGVSYASACTFAEGSLVKRCLRLHGRAYLINSTCFRDEAKCFPGVQQLSFIKSGRSHFGVGVDSAHAQA